MTNNSSKSVADYIKKLEKLGIPADREDYSAVCGMPKDAEFFCYQDTVNSKVKDVASHRVISDYIDTHGKDYRYQESEHPIKALADRACDNTEVGRSASECASVDGYAAD